MRAYPGTKKKTTSRAPGTTVSQLTRFRKKPYIPRPITQRYVGSRRYGGEVKTIDMQFRGAGAVPYVVDANSGNPYNAIPLYINTAQQLPIQAMNNTQQGAGIWNRIGNKITMKSLRIRGHFQTGANLEAVMQSQRILVIYDRQTNGTYPGWADIFRGIDSAGANITEDGMQSLNVNNLERFIVLMDELFIAVPQNTAAQNQNTFSGAWGCKFYGVDKYIRLRNLETVYNGTTNPATIANINTGALYMIFLGENANDMYYFVGDIRLRFHDN